MLGLTMAMKFISPKVDVHQRKLRKARTQILWCEEVIAKKHVFPTLHQGKLFLLDYLDVLDMILYHLYFLTS